MSIFSSFFVVFSDYFFSFSRFFFLFVFLICIHKYTKFIHMTFLKKIVRINFVYMCIYLVYIK